ncbi:MAG: DNA-binding protein [Deltaproteobacteria bacterium]|nr:DNA-binding protein [Deltaproteobacteria bacterium]
MANLIVRNLDEAIVTALKQRAARHGVSAEAEHRRILEEALRRPVRRSFAEVLASMPDAGRDEDFGRVEDSRSAPDVLG